MERGFGYAFGTVVALLWVWVSRTMPRIFMSLLDLIKGVQSKISESIIAGFTRFIDWVKTQDWKQIGTDIINGIIQGIQNGASALSDTLSNVASEALQGFKDTLKIQSPSRVMFEVGVNIMEGLDLGIEDQMGVIENRVNIVADGMIDQFSNMQPRNNNRGGLTINQYGADINTTWIPSYAR
jgi:phage-related minor tail protein